MKLSLFELNQWFLGECFQKTMGCMIKPRKIKQNYTVRAFPLKTTAL